MQSEWRPCNNVACAADGVAPMSVGDVSADPTAYMIYVPAVSWRRFFAFIRYA